MKDAVLNAKQAQVDAVADKMSRAESIIVVDYLGLSVAQVTDLRRQLHDADVEMKVVKNSILQRAAKQAGYEGLNETFAGPTAVAFSYEDPIIAAKIIAKFAETVEVLEIKGGMIEGQVQTLDKINEYAHMPSHDELLATLASMLQSPVRKFAYAVKAIAEKKEADDSAA
ncbi:MAG: 50S ribosomal protein L10 [Lactobacillus sp.]|uniref:Large ribosomal subunit protein uL10 n=1 Tax=Bombilactobacillus bombi TaxID=1303590 RepID=A0A347SQ36_9LACO|nr:50S ribosomal protein L10 [Bombilactobacillus bombi]MCO6541507.1 50S ribosomal protein L10 [Lactobacillus sp.]AXX64145.1 50S ribosomal protein L10 [Bombilactobacillus bombi]MCO6543505.1 50S ribosomal protein L10 [Lactobacillus sp.]RHW45073.1 50S ribosomal protein L10 [Bombilactobacillus bombi]RHW51849.1 50S ribosomal protein L10 [Bombilactobacillus bombi]